MQPEYLPPMETESIIRQDGCVQYPYTAMAVFQPGMEPTAQAQQQQQQAPAGMASQPHIASQAQAGPQASNSASSLPGSAASEEGTGGSGQSHVMPQGRAGAGQADVSAPQAAMRYPSGPVGLHMQQAASAYDSSLSGGMQTGMSRYPSSSQPLAMHGEMPLLILPSAYASADHATSMSTQRLCK